MKKNKHGAYSCTETRRHEFLQPSKKFAFTLAEVLITLGVIGIVAALTFPSLIQKHQERILITQLKESYSILSQAITLTYTDVGYTFSYADFLKHLQINKLCEQTYEGCANKARTDVTGSRTRYFGSSDTQVLRYIYANLSNGTIIRMDNKDMDCSEALTSDNSCGEVSIDVNGENGPNALGKDVFYFYFTKKGLIPFGHREDEKNSFERCTNGYVKEDVLKYDGYECTAWALYNENMDYLHCKDLSWTGKTRCK